MNFLTNLIFVLNLLKTPVSYTHLDVYKRQNILLKLYLKSLKNGGKLQLDEHIPYTCLLYTSRCV